MSTAVPKEDEDAIIRVTSYERKEIGFPFIRFDAPKVSFIREALRTPFAFPPEADLGAMKNLPVEILWQILRQLDIASLIHLRQVNRRARQIVTTMKEYHIITKYAILAVLALDDMEFTPEYTFADLQHAMRRDSCWRCGGFDGYIPIRAFHRVCFQCMQRDSDGLRNAYKHIPAEQLKAVKERYMVAAPSPHIGSDTKGEPPHVDHGIYCVGCYIALENNPDVIRRQSGSRFVTDLQNCAYSCEGFLEHFLWCPESKAMWEASQSGTVPVEVPEFVRKCRVDSAALAECLDQNFEKFSTASSTVRHHARGKRTDR